MCRFNSEPLLVGCGTQERNSSMQNARLSSLRSNANAMPLSDLQSLDGSLRLWSWDDLATTKYYY